MASTMDEDEDLDSATGSIRSNTFNFGNFHSDVVSINSMETVKPRIEGCLIKIGEISCFLNKFTLEDHHGY
ncbi:hypothetical protein L195_g014317 [Trifolium pratense]|uniref:Uncharacterized protein n=1 Tax=Trifolium pratense TaxID=57577 RepID=A0A2K3PQK8_TRIPR|nr:hypothetical protein L195_g014317 [Trifolium pratense]